MNDRGKSAIAAGDEVGQRLRTQSAGEKSQTAEQMLGRKTMEAEILRDALETAQAKKLRSRMPLLLFGRYPLIRIAEVLCVSRLNLYERLLKKRQRRSARCSKDDDARLLPLILQIYSERAGDKRLSSRDCAPQSCAEVTELAG